MTDDGVDGLLPPLGGPGASGVPGGLGGGRKEFDVFISYARKDDVPLGAGPVSAIRDLILAADAQTGFRPLRVFFDREDISDSVQWRQRISWALRSSRILLVCASPNYYESEWCRREFDMFLESLPRRQAELVGGDGDEKGPLTPVFFVDVPGGDFGEREAWRRRIEDTQGVDLREWFTEGRRWLELDEVRGRIARLGASVAERIVRAEQVSSAPGNLLRLNPYFVGRVEHLALLHEELHTGTATVGVITAVHGVGGMGKTELAIEYAHAYASTYAAGVWLVRAEGLSDLMVALARLIDEPAFGFDPGREVRAVPFEAGRAVAELVRRARAADSRVLVVLDNVTDPGLLSSDQARLLPDGDVVRVVATTRSGESEFGDRTGVAFVEVGGLSDAEGVRLIREYQPPRHPDAQVGEFASEADEADAWELVGELDGFTLAIEQVAIFLGQRRDVDLTPGILLGQLREHGVVKLGAHVPGKAADQYHQARTIAAVLETTLASLGPAERTALTFASLLPPRCGAVAVAGGIDGACASGRFCGAAV